jgi:hypothetical protein
VTRTELRSEFITVIRTIECVEILVKQVEWAGPATPHVLFHREIHPSSTSDSVLEVHVSRLLADEQFFGLCKECQEMNPRGWMHGPGLCQTCASTNHGVVY